MKAPLLFLLFTIQSIVVFGQKSMYDFVSLGKYKVGYTDTIVFDNRYHYEEFEYKGAKPITIRIWHPITKSNSNEFISYEDIFKVKGRVELEEIQKQMEKNGEEIFMRDFISENYETGHPNEFGDYTFNDIYDQIGKIKTRSCRAKLPMKTSFPVIVYHHGSQSNGAENVAMAEYFASRGYVFVSGDFHLPFANSTFGLKPFAKIIKNEEEESLNFIVNFAEKVSANSTLFFIGHSWGAQMGFRTFNTNSKIKGFVSLETTIEYTNDSNKIKEFWPEVYQKIVVEKVSYPFPIMLCAGTGKKGFSSFFNQVHAPYILYVPTSEKFDHNAYISSYYLRCFMDKTIPQTDEHVMKESLLLYAKHLDLMLRFFEEIERGKKKKGKETIEP